MKRNLSSTLLLLPLPLPLLLLLLLLAAFLPVATPAEGADDPPVGEIVELGEVEVTASVNEPRPVFTVEAPEFSFFDLPELPRGDLIVALHVIDLYRQTEIPDPERWAGILYFPWEDGRGNGHLKWLAVFRYDNRLFGIDPSAESTRQRLFHVPIPVDEHQNLQRWRSFADAFVAEISPGGYEETQYTSAYDPETGMEEDSLEIEIEPGRIAPVLASESDRPKEELVRLLYQFREAPNTRVARAARFGPSEEWRNRPVRFTDVIAPTRSRADHFRAARDLLAPRWSQRAVLHYRRKVLIFDQLRRRIEVLLFAVGPRIFAYHPRYGIWRTGLPIAELNMGSALPPEKIQIPGAARAERIELLPWPNLSSTRQ